MTRIVLQSIVTCAPFFGDQHAIVEDLDNLIALTQQHVVNAWFWMCSGKIPGCSWVKE